MQTARKAIGDIEEVYDSPQEQEALAPILEIRYTAMLNAVHELVRSTFPEMENFRLDDAATRRLLRFAADDVVRIDDTTKAAVREMLQRGQELGLSNWEIANGSPKDDFPGIEGLFKETWAGRANLIARNELAKAQIESSLDRYQATGLVDRVQLRDGTGSAPDEPCISRNGTGRAAEQSPAATPHCMHARNDPRASRRSVTASQQRAAGGPMSVYLARIYINGTVVPTDHHENWFSIQPHTRFAQVPEIGDAFYFENYEPDENGHYPCDERGAIIPVGSHAQGRGAGLSARRPEPVGVLPCVQPRR
jgi:hypothetical protein